MLFVTEYQSFQSKNIIPAYRWEPWNSVVGVLWLCAYIYTVVEDKLETSAPANTSKKWRIQKSGIGSEMMRTSFKTLIEIVTVKTTLHKRTPKLCSIYLQLEKLRISHIHLYICFPNIFRPTHPQNETVLRFPLDQHLWSTPVKTIYNPRII